MPVDEKKLLEEEISRRDQEIKELKELLAEAENEIKELNEFYGSQKEKSNVLESPTLNKMIKVAAFLLLCLIIVFIGLYPWFLKDKFFSNEGDRDTQIEEMAQVEEENGSEEVGAEENLGEGEGIESGDQSSGTENTADEPRDIFQPVKKMLVIQSDLGWLNVRTEPNVETGDVIKKINSDEEYEWVEKTDDGWYKIVLDEEGHTGYVSGDYVEEK